MSMQEITKRYPPDEHGVVRELRDKLVGLESPELIHEFRARRDVLEERLKSGEVESADICESRRIAWTDPCPCGSQNLFRECCGARLWNQDPNDERIVAEQSGNVGDPKETSGSSSGRG